MTDGSQWSDSSTNSPDELRRLESLAAEWDKTQSSHSGAAMVQSLQRGMATVADLMFTRVHEDVERNFGADSMLIPTSIDKVEKRARLEIALYEVAESTCLVQSEKWVADGDWYFDWLGRLRLNQQFADRRAALRATTYLELSDDARRLEFARVLQKAIAEAAQTPLVLFRIAPLAIRVVTAVAFGKAEHAQSLRDEQSALLPAIVCCSQCHGRPLGNGETCRECGNPIWKFRWLTEAD